MSEKMVAFDLAGTLIDGKAFRDARSSLINSEWGKWEEEADFPHKFDYKPVFQAWLDDASPEILYREFRDFLLKQVTDYLFSEVPQVLQALYNKGFRLGFVTDGSDAVEGDMIRCILNALGIPIKECIIVTGEKTNHPKKDGQPFKKLLHEAEKHGINIENVVFVGDTLEKDIKPAHMLGIKPVLVVRGDQSFPSSTNAIFIFRDLLGIVAKLPELFTNYMEVA